MPVDNGIYYSLSENSPNIFHPTGIDPRCRRQPLGLAFQPAPHTRHESHCPGPYPVMESPKVLAGNPFWTMPGMCSILCMH